jgi:hypothetical protein
MALKWKIEKMIVSIDSDLELIEDKIKQKENSGWELKEVLMTDGRVLLFFRKDE